MAFVVGIVLSRLSIQEHILSVERQSEVIEIKKWACIAQWTDILLY